MKLTTTAITLALLGASTLEMQAQVETFDVPKLDSVSIDGDFSDWDSEPGFGVEILLQEAGDLKSPDDHNVQFRMGWCEEGLLILIEVEDNSWIEYPEKGKYYSADVVEVFLCAKRGNQDVCQWYVSPGMSGELREPGVRFRELRRGPTKGMPSDLKVFREKLGASRYRMEMLAPWSAIGMEGKADATAAFQIWVNDKDEGDRRSRYMSTFYPAKGASYATNAMHNIRLVDHSEPSLRLSSLPGYDMEKFQPFVQVWAGAGRSGKPIAIRQGDVVIGSAVLDDSESPGRATAKVLLPPAPAGQPYENLGVFLGDQSVNSVRLPYSDIMGAVKKLHRDRARLREEFQLDAPWMDLKDPLLDRHRGLAAAGLNQLEETPPPSSEDDMEVLAWTIEMVSMLEKGEDYFAGRRNGFWGYYFCKADGTGQRFAVTLPRNYDPERRYPLFLELHGNGGRPLPPKGEPKQDDFIRLRPWGRGDISFFGLGEVDVLESLRHVMKWYSADPNQICLGGHSMGGNGTWDLASKYTDLFACLAPKAGRSSDDYYENFRHLPALIQHGAKDGSQPVEFGRYTASRLQQMGFSVIYKEFPDDGHGIRNPFPVEEWFVNQRRPRSPKVITYTCDTVDRGEIYWARIRRFIDPHRAASITARVTNDASDSRVDLELRNVKVIELNLSDLPSDRSRPLTLKVGDSEFELEAPQPGRILLINEEGRWETVETWEPPAGKKRPYLPGGAANLYSGEPLLIVYPTEGNEETRQPMEDAARSIVLFGGFGNEMITGQVPIKPDKEVTEDDIQHRNLILFGGPYYNLITRRLTDQLPVTVNERNQFVVEGHDPVEVNQATLTMTTYNPLAPKRLIHLIWQDEIPAEARSRFLRSARYRLSGSSGRYPHNIPDLQITSPEPGLSIRRQFTHDWAFKPRDGMDRTQSLEAIEDGIPLTQLKIMKRKADVDFAIGPKRGGWGTPAAEPPTLDEFRYRNYRINTYVAEIRGKLLAEILTNPDFDRLEIYPQIAEEDLDPGQLYRVVSPENALWVAKPIMKGLWKEMEAGPDVLKSDITREVYEIE